MKSLARRSEEIVEEMSDDIALLDALLAWTQNPTSMSAGYALPAHYRRIESIIEKRHPGRNASDVVEKLSVIIEEIIERLGKSIDDVKGDPVIDDLQEAFRIEIVENHMDRLIEWFVSVLKDETRPVRDIIHSLKSYEDKDGLLDISGINPDVLKASYQAIFDYLFPDSINLDRVGFTNTLYYESSNGATSGHKSLITPYAWEVARNIGDYREELNLSELPEIDISHIAKSIVDDCNDQEVLLSFLCENRFLQEGRYWNYLQNLCDFDKWHSIPHVIASYENTWAINPFIRKELKVEIALARKEALQYFAEEANVCFRKIQNENKTRRYFRDIQFHKSNGVFKGKFESSDFGKHDYVIVSSAVTPYLHELNGRGGAFFLVVGHHPLHVEQWLNSESTAIVQYEDTLSLLGKETDIANAVHSCLHSPVESKSEAKDEKEEEHKIDLLPPSETHDEPKPLEKLDENLPSDHLVLGDIVDTDSAKNVIANDNLSATEKLKHLQRIESFNYPLAKVATHTAIFGKTGSGKTTTVNKIVHELIKENVPFTILDWHSEYTEILRNTGGKIYHPPTAKIPVSEGEIPFTWNPLDHRFYSPKKSKEILEDYFSKIIGMLEPKDVMKLTTSQKAVLLRVLRRAYTPYMQKNKGIPTFEDLLRILREEDIDGHSGAIQALRTRLETMGSGTWSSIFCKKTSFDPQTFFDESACVKMKHLTEDFRGAILLLTQFILQQELAYFKRFRKHRSDSAKLRHVIIIDESQELFTETGIASQIESILQEMRGFGVGLILVARHTDIPRSIIRETNTKIIHSLEDPKDVRVVVKLANMEADQRTLLKNLPPGAAFFRLSGRNTRLVRIIPP